MHVLIIEDEDKIARILVDYFEREDFVCETLSRGDLAVDRIARGQVDFVVLDLMLPGKDGISICKEVRQFSSVPILMLTARGDEIDRLLGLELGADDYVCKPFSPREVVSRAKAILRRVKGDQPITQLTSHRGVSIDMARHTCVIARQQIELTPVEFRLLHTMISSPERVFSRAQLMHAAYEDRRVVSDRTIDSHVKNLRRKLAEHSDEPLIRAVYGVGYKFC